ncbi:MAG: sulfatase-like hydrolase/transferase [Oscillospiraceae bacterium]|nr:sulfatase-like hydrolase/transferase [Oscillospiraceae bacterium]
MNEKIKRFLLIYPHIFPILLFLSLEIQNSSKSHFNLPALILSCVLLYVSLMILFALTGKVFLSGVLASLILVIFYTVNFYRQMQTGQVLLPHDLNSARYIGSIFTFADMPVHWRPVCSILCVAALHVPLFYISKRVRFSIKKRAVIFAVSGALMYLLFFTRFSQEVILTAIVANASTGAGFSDIYGEPGALLGFYSVGVADDMTEPEGYSPAFMETLASKVVKNIKVAGNLKGMGGAEIGGGAEAGGRSKGNESAKEGVREEKIKPDVIVVLSESYWDPTVLPNITFSEDPVPNLHRLKSITTSGNVVCPTFGGMTCNAEYELLTGNSFKLVGYGDTPYYKQKTYIDRDNGRSLISMFKANGYRTVALHTYMSSFYGRNIIYPKLGFETFIASEDMPDAHLKGSLRGQEIISDEYFCDTLIETIENTTDPLFLFGITMQNHTPYFPEKYETTQIHADCGGLVSEETLEHIDTYIEGVYDADKVLGRLYEYVMESDKPIILLYFGDHLPLLTRHTEVYTDLGYISEGSLDDLSVGDAHKLYTTPYIAFSNCRELPPTWGEVSMFYLGAILADEAGIEKNLYYHFLSQAFERFQAMNMYLYIADGGVYDAPREEDRDIIEMFTDFQYDKLFGKGYLDEAMSRIPVARD